MLSVGEHVILMLDGNADMRDSFLSNTFQLVHLRELILHRHDNQGPSTFRRNNSNTPIDGIWASAGISILKGGYLDYDQVLMGANHKCLWLDIHFQVAFGSKLPPISSPKTRRLHCRDPRVVKNYLRVYEKAAMASNLLYRVETLAAKVTYPLPPLLQQEYEELDALHCQFTEEAERKCRKLCKGQVAFSPDLQNASRVIKVFTLLLKKKQGRKVSSRLIARSLKKTDLSSEVYSLSLTELQSQLKESFNKYYKVKKEHDKRRQTHLENLAQAIAEDNNMDKAVMLQQLRTRESQRSVACKIRFLQGKVRTGGTTMVTVETPAGGLQDLTEKNQVEVAIMQSNASKFTQSHLEGHLLVFQL